MEFRNSKEIAFDLFNANSLIAVLLILVHQSLIAFSVYSSVQIVYALDHYGFDSAEFRLWLLSYVACMTLPHGIAYFSDVYEERWLCSCFNLFWDSAAKKYQQCTERTQRDKVLGTFVTQGKESITSYVRYCLESWATFLNFFLSLLVISFTLDYRFIFTVMISILLVGIVQHWVSRTMEHLAIERTQAGANVTNELASIHDNVHNGSPVNYQSFLSTKKVKVTRYLTARMSEAKYKYKVYFIISMCSLLPTISFMVWMLANHEVSDSIKFALVINLTRIFYLLNSATGLITIVISFPNMKGQIKLLEVFSRPVEKHLFEHSRVSIIDESVAQVESQEKLLHANHGLYSVRGPNGSGKTTFLMSLREQTGAYYFNPRYRLSWPWGGDEQQADLSDGQYSRACLEWLINETTDNLLLDEWDAFLDSTNTNYIESLIKHSQHQRKIVQVRQ
ncbi:ABC transporter ATP-binding protein [Vibrio tritonius]|uniref:ABC transporter ATP-binding protein n=1 Tax=Vibrio tritonius TaxID=1435069 RepID=A0ABS7YQ86_9VIBR|nr:ABC transporter ATP-binding protein [Vibrio tritonius]MCA2017232.1 ABC transporter ATP-binding protein [Vibrio tritonius]